MRKRLGEGSFLEELIERVGGCFLCLRATQRLYEEFSEIKIKTVIEYFVHLLLRRFRDCVPYIDLTLRNILVTPT